MSKVYVSFDIEHDRELYERLLAESAAAGFSVSGRSECRLATELWGARIRQRIREADQVIVICGEHTGASQCMGAEIRIAQEERTPYFLLWGRREALCRKPRGAKTADGMYRWTREILHDQIAGAQRRSRPQRAIDMTRKV